MSKSKWLPPMLATLTDKYFSSEDWIYEPKWDGVRAIAYLSGRRVHIYSRNKLDLSHTFPEVVESLKKMNMKAILDGEIVTFRGKCSSFSKLQKRLGVNMPSVSLKREVPVWFYLFDILSYRGKEITSVPLLERKSILKKVGVVGRVKLTPHVKTKGEGYLEKMCRRGEEGVIAKRAASHYLHNRSRDWLKFKCAKGQEFVIGGYTLPQGSRSGFGALLVGYYEKGELKYAGKVGTGFDDEFLVSFSKKLSSVSRASSPFSGNIKEKSARWVRPMYVVDVAFAEWTRDGKLRHPRFKGLRFDKSAKNISRERSR